MRKIYILVLLLIIVIGAAVFVSLNNTGNKSTQPIACTMEAKLCSDGSAVGRTGPNCEFASCPDVVPTPTPTPVATTGDIVLALGQKGKVGDLNITLNSIVQDSRCPVGVQCIWAGEVKANVTLLGALKTEAIVLSSIDKPYSFDGYRISIINVTRGEYRVTFHVAVEPKKAIEKDLQSTGTIKGSVTLSPICPVERIPREIECAPKPYQTKIEAFTSPGGKLVSSTQTGVDGSFALTLPFGIYNIQAGGGIIHPSCSPVVISLKTTTTLIDISCDTGIR